MGSSAPLLGVAPAPASALDPSLAALFASSSGPIKPPAIARNSVAASSSHQTQSSADSASDSSSEHEPEPEHELAGSRPAKRRRLAEPDLEAAYFQRLAREEEREQRQEDADTDNNDDDKDGGSDGDSGGDGDGDSDGDSDSARDNGVRDADDNDDIDQDNSNPEAMRHNIDSDPRSTSVASELYSDDDEEDGAYAIPNHESLTKNDKNKDQEKARRTVFLSNVSTAAIKSKASKKILLDHLQTAIPDDQLPTTTKLIQSFRFRSTPYVADGGPKRATYAKKELMEQTAHSTNAYAVFSSEQAANLVVEKLNGTVVLDRHLRLDKVTSPAAIDHKRCVFIGNLPFMDEELSENKAPVPDGAPPRRPKAKQPADAEEGLWRAFSKVGKVENVRVVRDKETRVSKGFAYVQFADPNTVEAALLFDGKKFPPLLPRILRVSRARRPRSNASSAPSSKKSFSGAPSKRNRPSQNHHNQHQSPAKRSSSLVFEGHRASSQSRPRLNARPKKRATKPTGRSARRGASFKASGGVKNRDRKTQ